MDTLEAKNKEYANLANVITLNCDYQDEIKKELETDSHVLSNQGKPAMILS